MWKGKFFSVGGIEILIKAVAQATSTYTMSVFRIPSTLCNELQSLVSRFWRGGNVEDRKIHQVRWEMLCRSKVEGGMSFRDRKAFNRALLAKRS